MLIDIHAHFIEPAESPGMLDDYRHSFYSGMNSYRRFRLIVLLSRRQSRGPKKFLFLRSIVIRSKFRPSLCRMRFSPLSAAMPRCKSYRRGFLSGSAFIVVVEVRQQLSSHRRPGQYRLIDGLAGPCRIGEARRVAQHEMLVFLAID